MICYNQGLWAKTNPFTTKLLCVGIFYHSNANETKPNIKLSLHLYPPLASASTWLGFPCGLLHVRHCTVKTLLQGQNFTHLFSVMLSLPLASSKLTQVYPAQSVSTWNGLEKGVCTICQLLGSFCLLWLQPWKSKLMCCRTSDYPLCGSTSKPRDISETSSFIGIQTIHLYLLNYPPTYFLHVSHRSHQPSLSSKGMLSRDPLHSYLLATV